MIRTFLFLILVQNVDARTYAYETRSDRVVIGWCNAVPLHWHPTGCVHSKKWIDDIEADIGAPLRDKKTRVENWKWDGSGFALRPLADRRAAKRKFYKPKAREAYKAWKAQKEACVDQPVLCDAEERARLRTTFLDLKDRATQ